MGASVEPAIGVLGGAGLFTAANSRVTVGADETPLISFLPHTLLHSLYKETYL